MSELRAGAEMDQEIAINVFGWRWAQFTDAARSTPHLVDEPRHRVILSPARFRDAVVQGVIVDAPADMTLPAGFFLLVSDSPPRYSTDPAAAFLVLDWLVAHAPQHDLHLETLGGCGWKVSCCHEDDSWRRWIDGETLPEAVCRAALALAARRAGGG